MLWFRLARALTAGVGMLAPLCTLWALMVPYAANTNGPAEGARIPNPSKAPVSMLGSADVLVHADPWFAGTIGYWIVVCSTVAAALIVAALCVPAPPSERAIRRRSLRIWGVGSLLLGLLFAAPWFYGLFRLLTRSG